MQGLISDQKRPTRRDLSRTWIHTLKTQCERFLPELSFDGHRLESDGVAPLQGLFAFWMQTQGCASRIRGTFPGLSDCVPLGLLQLRAPRHTLSPHRDALASVATCSAL